MKTNVCPLSGQEGQLEAVFAEVEKCASYNRLDAKHTLRLRLLAEEMAEMLPSLLRCAEGSFWVENEGSQYELHLTARAKKLSFDERENVIAMSKSGKNAAAVGIMGKIRAAAETMLLASDDAAVYMDYADVNMGTSSVYNHVWSMSAYATQVRQNADGEEAQEKWDELEKSIIANLADDVIVGVKGKQVDIIVRKDMK